MADSVSSGVHSVNYAFLHIRICRRDWSAAQNISRVSFLFVCLFFVILLFLFLVGEA